MESSPNASLKRSRESQFITQRVSTVFEGRAIKAFITTADFVDIIDISLLPDNNVLAASSTSAPTDELIPVNIKYEWKETLKELTMRDCTFNSVTKKWQVPSSTLTRMGMTCVQLEQAVKELYYRNNSHSAVSIPKPTVNGETRTNSGEEETM